MQANCGLATVQNEQKKQADDHHGPTGLCEQDLHYAKCTSLVPIHLKNVNFENAFLSSAMPPGYKLDHVLKKC